jgi:hypothetical protein
MVEAMGFDHVVHWVVLRDGIGACGINRGPVRPRFAARRFGWVAWALMSWTETDGRWR